MTVMGFADNISIFTFIFMISITHVLLPNKSVRTKSVRPMSPLQPSMSTVATNSSHLTAMVLLTVSSANEILLLDLISSTALMNHSASNWSEGHTMATTLCLCKAMLLFPGKSFTTKIVVQVPS